MRLSWQAAPIPTIRRPAAMGSFMSWELMNLGTRGKEPFKIEIVKVLAARPIVTIPMMKSERRPTNTRLILIARPRTL
jgi:hypothetical protein